MGETDRSAIAAMDGAAALPRLNGELVFEAPWEGRAFGLAVSLNERGLYDWPSFRDELVAHIASADSNGRKSGYYEQWLASLEQLLISRGVISRDEIEARATEITREEHY
jgi:nitrile hydratase accessory protein